MKNKGKGPDSAKDQSARFIEAAKKIGSDETGKKFERAFGKIAKKKARKPDRVD